MSYPPKFLTGIWFPTQSSLVVQFGGPELTDDIAIMRLFINGPSGSTFNLHVSQENPAYMISTQVAGKYQCDYSLTGQQDYASYNPPLPLLAGFWLAGAWVGGSTGALSVGTMRMEYADAA